MDLTFVPDNPTSIDPSESSITATRRAAPSVSESLTEKADTRHHHIDKRNACPSRTSVHSISSNISTSTTNLDVPKLKRKHGHKHMRQQLNAATVSLPTASATTRAVNSASPLQPHSKQTAPRPPYLFLTRSNTAPSPKRPPASHSSYGVETIVGPPPSFDTRRTLSTERVWKAESSKSLRTTPIERAEGQLHSIAPNEPNEEHWSDCGQPPFTTPLPVDSSPETADTQSIATPTDGEEVLVMDTRSEQGLGLSHSEGGSGSKASSESRKSEDLFLNIAKVDASHPIFPRGEKRKSRISLPFLSSARPATSHTNESSQPHTESLAATPRAELPAYQSKRSSLQFGHLRGPSQASDLEPSHTQNTGLYSHRSSTMYADTIRAPAHSGTGTRGNRLVSESGHMDKSKATDQNATESTASTTAPSTVWDELDDLKSRIRKLELTGKLPPSSAAAMVSAERPRTATTAATTMSSSPKHNKTPSQLQSTIEGVPHNVHPLLHEALGNAKAIVSHDVYQKLLATAQDALQLATMTSLDNQSVRSGIPAMSERQIRRRIESMCRSLTELAIALATESKVSQPSYRPVSRDNHISPSIGLRNREYGQSNEQTDRSPVSTRVQSRLENRRISTQTIQARPRHASPERESPTALPQYSTSGGTTTRRTSHLRNRRTQGFIDGANDDSESSPGVRPVSRAMTDLAITRRPSRGNYAALSREYTSQHPLPSTKDDTSSTARTPLPANITSNLVSRRKFPSPVGQTAQADSSPLASRQSWGRISIVQNETTPSSDTVSEAPGSTSSIRTRRSLGFASRIGSSVGSRLRAARAERMDSHSYNEPPSSTTNNEMIG